MSDSLPRVQKYLLTRAKSLALESLDLFWTLAKIMVPVVVAVRVLDQLGAIEWIGVALGPVMEVVGLPGVTGLVFAKAVFTGLYTAMVVFAGVAPALDLTVAQVTVLGAMMLLGHALPIELRIAQQAGARMRAMGALRLGGAVAIGWLLHQVYSRFNLLQKPNRMLWQPPEQDPSWTSWALGEARNLAYILAILVVLLLALKLLRKMGITELLTRLLRPALRTLGMSDEAAPVTIVGMTLGLGYGGGLIIKEARSGRLSDRDIFFSLSLMGLCHSLIEDTTLMLALGGHHSGLLWARLAFSFAVVLPIVKAVQRMPEEAFQRHLFRSVAQHVGDDEQS